MTVREKLIELLPAALCPQSVEEVADFLISKGVTFCNRTPIETLGLSLRSYNSLKRARIDTVEELSLMGESGLLRLRGLGEVRKKEIMQKLKEAQG